MIYGIGGGKLSAESSGIRPITSQEGILLDVNGDHALDLIGIDSYGITRVLNTGDKTPVTK